MGFYKSISICTTVTISYYIIIEIYMYICEIYVYICEIYVYICELIEHY